MNQVLNPGIARGYPVSKKKAEPAAAASSGRQVNFRATDELYSRLERVSITFGVDMSNLIRLVLHQNLKRYEDEARRLEEEQGKASS